MTRSRKISFKSQFDAPSIYCCQIYTIWACPKTLVHGVSAELEEVFVKEEKKEENTNEKMGIKIRAQLWYAQKSLFCSNTVMFILS